MPQSQLILIPVPLQEEGAADTLAPANLPLIEPLKHFVVENVRTARRMLRQMGYKSDFDSVRFYEMGKHAEGNQLHEALQQLKNGQDVGLLSEAGLPCIADPGYEMVRLAQDAGISVLPLPGPSSLMLALMGSGFNGQSFRFVGYLPIDEKERAQSIRDLEKLARKGETQIFIETPFRNRQMLEAIIRNAQPDIRLCIACNLSLPEGYVKTRSLQQWKKELPELHKKLCVFLLGR